MLTNVPNVPEWFISPLTFGAAEIQRNRLEILHLFSLYKKTTIQRSYVDTKSGKWWKFTNWKVLGFVFREIVDSCELIFDNLG